jgi:PAS domain S-box-containing protein
VSSDRHVVRILLVEDNPADERLFRETCRDCPGLVVDVAWEQSMAAAIGRLAAGVFDVVVLDLELPDCTGLETLRAVLKAAPSVPVVVLTGLRDDAMTVEALREGAQDYLLKGELGPALCCRTLRYAIERKRAEAQLRFQAALIASIQDAVVATDLDSIITSWNQGAELTYGYWASEAIGRDVCELLHTGFPATPREVALAKLMEEGSWLGELTHARKDGRRLDVMASVALVKNRAGVPVGVVAVNRDVTEMKALELERERLIGELKEALSNVKTLGGLLPICANCKKIRDDTGFWQAVEVFVRQRTDARFSHGICPDCARQLYPGLLGDDETQA